MDNMVTCYSAIQKVQDSQMSYCKFLSANDTGLTGGHQSGIYVSKLAHEILFETKGNRGENKERLIRIKWQDDFFTDSRFIYYGKGTRNEYRITRFGRGFPYLTQNNTGDLFILCKFSNEDYFAYLLSTDDEINNFLDAFGMNPTDTDSIIEKKPYVYESKETREMDIFIESLEVEFPTTVVMASKAQEIYDKVYNNQNLIIKNPDKIIIKWTETEYRLFKHLEYNRYRSIITDGFETVDEFIKKANTILNRRKSRAGKSLEHHLSSIFDYNNLVYTSQGKTEGNKTPDFIFPTIDDYHDIRVPNEKLVFLGAKTTCKDRWRQILNEADRIQVKHLFTLQQGISPRQLEEMKAENVTLVVPQKYINTYPTENREDIWNLKRFIEYVKEKEKRY